MGRKGMDEHSESGGIGRPDFSVYGTRGKRRRVSDSGIFRILLFSIGSLFLFSCRESGKSSEKSLTDFIIRYEQTMIPLSTQINLARWKYAETGSVAYLRLFDSLNDLKIAYLNNPQSFSYLKKLKEEDDIQDIYLQRQRDILYNTYLPHQVPIDLQERIIRLESFLRDQVWRRMSDKEVIDAEAIVRHSDNDRELQRAWRFLKESGLKTVDSLMELVRLRNLQAVQTGFPDYFHMKMFLDEQRIPFVDSLFFQLARETDSAYREMKAGLDRDLCRLHALESSELRPWHYRGTFFQYNRRAADAGRDNYYSYVNMVNVAVRFYAGIGLDFEDILSRSILSARAGQLPVFSCVSIDRKHDVRIICNIGGTENDMRMLLARAGQAIYFKDIPNTLPYLLRFPSSSVLSSGIASFFARMTGYSNWILSMGILSAGQAGELHGTAYRSLRREQLFACRWSLLMYDFEKRMYADPSQDLDSLWQRLFLKYLLIEPGEDRYGMADWAADSYFSLSACHFHAFMLGELWASQLLDYLCRTDSRLGSATDPNMVGNEAVGTYFRKYVFDPGSSMTWEHLTREASGESLSVRAFIEQFAR